MYITRPLHIVSHPLYTENYMQVGDSESKRLITMTSLPVANNVQYTHYIHIVYTKTLLLSFIQDTGSRHGKQTILIELFLVYTLLSSQHEINLYITFYRLKVYII